MVVVNVGVGSLVGPLGPLEKTVFGGVVSTRHVWVAGVPSAWPSAFTARTSKR